MKLAGQTGTGVSALLSGVVVTLSYGHVLWANAILSWIPVLVVLGFTEPPAALPRAKKWSEDFKEVLSTTLVGDGYPEGRPRAPEETAAWLRATLAGYEQLALGYLAVLRKEDGALIGRSGSPARPPTSS